MGELTLIIILLLSVVVHISRKMLGKNIKDFNIHFDLSSGFDISGSFFDEKQPPEHQI